MGIPLQKEVKECPICRKRIDGFNFQHILLCSTKKALIQCHDAIKHCVKDLCAEAGLHVDVEASPFGKRVSSEKKERPEGALTSSSTTAMGREALVLAVDISIANPFSKVGGAIPNTLAAATEQGSGQDE